MKESIGFKLHMHLGGACLSAHEGTTRAPADGVKPRKLGNESCLAHFAPVETKQNLMSTQVWRVELAASTSGNSIGGSSSSNTRSSSPPPPKRANASGSPYDYGQGGGGGPGVIPSNANAFSRRRHSGGNVYGGNTGGGGAGGNGGAFDPTLAAISSSASSGGGQGAGGARYRGSGSALRVSGSSMVRSVFPDDGAVVSVHHFNTELGSPLVYGTRRGGVRSWDLRAREVRWDG